MKEGQEPDEPWLPFACASSTYFRSLIMSIPQPPCEGNQHGTPATTDHRTAKLQKLLALVRNCNLEIEVAVALDLIETDTTCDRVHFALLGVAHLFLTIRDALRRFPGGKQVYLPVLWIMVLCHHWLH